MKIYEKKREFLFNVIKEAPFEFTSKIEMEFNHLKCILQNPGMIENFNMSELSEWFQDCLVRKENLSQNMKDMESTYIRLLKEVSILIKNIKNKS